MRWQKYSDQEKPMPRTQGLGLTIPEARFAGSATPASASKAASAAGKMDRSPIPAGARMR